MSYGLLCGSPEHVQARKAHYGQFMLSQEYTKETKYLWLSTRAGHGQVCPVSAHCESSAQGGPGMLSRSRGLKSESGQIHDPTTSLRRPRHSQTSWTSLRSMWSSESSTHIKSPQLDLASHHPPCLIPPGLHTSIRRRPSLPKAPRRTPYERTSHLLFTV